MNIRLTTLSENTASRMGLLGEWGLSILVEVEDLSILLDTGQTISAAHNATAMGIDLSQIDKIVLSHGHVDHTGGLKQVLSGIGHEVEVIAHPDIWAPKYASSRTGEETRYNYIGIPFQRKEMEELGAKFHLTTEPTWLSEKVVTSGEVPMTTSYEAVDDPRLVVKENREYRPDPIRDDQALFVVTELGLVVIAGCAHRGIINTIEHAQRLTGVESVFAIVGGTHLGNASVERVDLTIAALLEKDVQHVGVSHCTGLPAAARMAGVLEERFFFNNAGTVIIW